MVGRLRLNLRRRVAGAAGNDLDGKTAPAANTLWGRGGEDPHPAARA